MVNYLCSVSGNFPENYQIGLRAGVWGVEEKYANKIEHVCPGDRLVFVVGGAYGFSEEVYNKSRSKISLSKLTFSHQMVRLFAVEQLYRSFTILKNEPYHHE